MLLQPIARIAQFDLNFSILCLDHRFSIEVAKVCRWISRTGDGPLYVVLAMALLWLRPTLGWSFLCAGLLAFAIELPIYWLTKNAVRRRRPAELTRVIPAFITPSDRYSLPSGHSAAAMVMATLIAYFFPAFAVVALLWAMAVGLSRILLGVHFLSDVIVGMLLGAASANAALLMVS
ncbi:phosphatase PAP2 family protein [Vibrio ulleungensis]|uniref:undecaprenyl-diphosphate phosphatase n=1 Tax=Vibrio ulleungensis TaxID=2807619 RepID=A0ABS2HJT2_9VIBR|nr:phosphatase PAP2 family protein [Vibrio ulleungensis]MBM7037376.1 phosphatase PAP2 family protein [Vibrio ulleungensis]